MREPKPVVVLETEEQPPRAISTTLFGIKDVLIAQRTSLQVTHTVGFVQRKTVEYNAEPERQGDMFKVLAIAGVTTLEDSLRFNLKKEKWWLPWTFWTVRKWNHYFSAKHIQETLTIPQIEHLVAQIHTLEAHGDLTANGEKKKEMTTVVKK